MSTFTFLHAADLHLDSPLKGLETYPDAPVEQIRNATRRALDNLVDLALSEKVSFVLLAGDLFDGPWKDFNTALFFADRMGRLSRNGIPVYLVFGNHDAASQISRAMRLPENVHVFSHKCAETVVLEEIQVALHGQGYATRDIQENLAAGFPDAVPSYFNIGLLHTSLTGREGHQSYAPCSMDDLKRSGYDYWALGHVHQREIVCQSPLVVFPGCIQGRHIREQGPKGATLVSVRENRIMAVDHRELDVMRWAKCSVCLSDCSSRSSATDRIRDELIRLQGESDGRPLAVRVALHGACPVHGELQEDLDGFKEEIRVIAVGLGDVWPERIRVETSPERIGNPDLESVSHLSDLAATLWTLTPDFDELSREIPELKELKNKLPVELLKAEEPFDPTDPQILEKLAGDIGDLLLTRLLNHEEGS